MSQVAAKVLASAARQVSKTVPQVSYQFIELSVLNRCRQLYFMEAILFQSKTMLGKNDIIKVSTDDFYEFYTFRSPSKLQLLEY